MDINNITNSFNGKATDTNSTTESRAASGSSAISKSNNGFADKVSLGNYSANKGEELFAKIEMEKLNQSSFDKLKTMKANISEYQAAKEISPEAANETEIGKLLNNPDVWGEIADKIIG